jgi:hypothetical protein
MAKDRVTVELSREAVRELTRAWVVKRIEGMRNLVEVASFILSDPAMCGTVWPEELVPFYELYGNPKTAACEMGKLIAQEAKRLGLNSRAEPRFGKENAITRHSFPKPPESLAAGGGR